MLASKNRGRHPDAAKTWFLIRKSWLWLIRQRPSIEIYLYYLLQEMWWMWECRTMSSYLSTRDESKCPLIVRHIMNVFFSYLWIQLRGSQNIEKFILHHLWKNIFAHYGTVLHSENVSAKAKIYGSSGSGSTTLVLMKCRTKIDVFVCFMCKSQWFCSLRKGIRNRKHKILLMYADYWYALASLAEKHFQHLSLLAYP